MFWSDFPIFSVNPSTLVAGLTTVCTAVFQSRTRPVTWAVSTWSTLSHTSCRTLCPALSLYPGHLRLMLATPATPGHHPSELRVRTSSPGLWVSMTTAWRTRWWWTTDCPRTTMTLTTPAAVSSPSILHWPDEILVIILLSVWKYRAKDCYRTLWRRHFSDSTVSDFTRLNTLVATRPRHGRLLVTVRVSPPSLLSEKVTRPPRSVLVAVCSTRRHWSRSLQLRTLSTILPSQSSSNSV